MLQFHPSRHSTLRWLGSGFILAAGLLGDTRFSATRTSADGVLTGKKYDNVRHTATLSFEVPR